MDVFKQIAEFINWIYETVKTLPDLFDGLLARIVSWTIVQWFEAKRATIEFVYYNIGQPVVASLNLGDEITAAMSGIDPQIMSVLAYVGALESLNIILSAYVTRFVLSMVPGV